MVSKEEITNLGEYMNNFDIEESTSKEVAHYALFLKKISLVS